MIHPTIGRVVHFYGAGGQGPFAALVCYVGDDRLVNLAVFDSYGVATNFTSVPLVQPEDEQAFPAGVHCRWMPYQVKNPTGSESGEKAAGVEAV